MVSQWPILMVSQYTSCFGRLEAFVRSGGINQSRSWNSYQACARVFDLVNYKINITMLAIVFLKMKIWLEANRSNDHVCFQTQL